MTAPTAGYNVSSGPLPGMRIPNPLRPDATGLYRPFTVEHWYFLHALPSNAGVLTSILPGSGFQSTGVNLYFRTEGGMGFHFGLNGGHLRGGNHVTGAWTHLAWVFTGTQAQVWQNGAMVASGGIGNGTLAGSSSFWHSVFDSTVVGADCRIARLRFWDRALSGADISASMNAVVLPLGTADLLAEYRLDSGHSVEVASVAPMAQLLGNVSTLRTVAGTVLDDAGGPAQRTVRVYSRLTGQLVGQTNSSSGGGYTAQFPLAPGEVNVVCLDDAAGTVYNDLVLRTTV